MTEEIRFSAEFRICFRDQV